MLMRLLIYDLLLWGILPLAWPLFFLRRLLTGKPVPEFRRRLAWELPPAPPDGSLPIWIHAVSVGEALVVAPLVQQLQNVLPRSAIYVSTTTPTGQAAALKTYGDRVTVFYSPFDLPGAVRRVLRHIRPRLLIIAETELWPNLIHQAHSRQVPVAIVNGRISDRAWPRYRRFRALLAPFLGQLSAVQAQSSLDAKRFALLGAEHVRVRVSGNMKFDTLKQIVPDGSLATLIRQSMGDGPVWICGSTMPGEEQAVGEAFRRLLDRFPDLRLIVAPRHPERFGEAESCLRALGFRTQRRTALDGSHPETCEALVLDTIGELAGLYAMSSVVFVGGTLSGTGGHNILEPAAAGVPVLVGPSMENFREIHTLFTSRGAVRTLSGAHELEATVTQLLTQPGMATDQVQAALTLISENVGATNRNLEILLSLIG